MPSSLVTSCRFTPTTGGTTDWTYFAAVVGYNTPALAGVATTLIYSVRSESANLTQWEESVGACTIAAGVATFARTTVLYNSSGTGTGPGQSGAGTKINFTTAPEVSVVALAEDLLAFNAAMSLTGAQQVQALQNLGAFASSFTTSGTATLGASHVGRVIFPTGSGQTHTLPSAAAFSNQVFIIWNNQALLTVARSGTDSILGPSSPGGVTSMALGVGDFVAVIGISSGFWLVINGSPAALGVGASLTNSLAADVNMNVQANYFAGPVVAQGSIGTWQVTGHVTYRDTATPATGFFKLTDGTTVYDSAPFTTAAASYVGQVALSAVVTNPAGNLRIDGRSPNTTTGQMVFNGSGNSKDCTITAVRIK